MNIYLNVSLYGDNVRFFRLCTAGRDQPEYFNNRKAFQIDHQIKIMIENWIRMCHRAINEEEPPVEKRSHEDDLGVVVEFHRRYLINQDTVCIATCVEQIALNNVLTTKLRNQVYVLAEQLSQDPHIRMLLAETL